MNDLKAYKHLSQTEKQEAFDLYQDLINKRNSGSSARSLVSEKLKIKLSTVETLAKYGPITSKRNSYQEIIIQGKEEKIASEYSDFSNLVDDILRKYNISKQTLYKIRDVKGVASRKQRINEKERGLEKEINYARDSPNIILPPKSNTNENNSGNYRKLLKRISAAVAGIAVVAGSFMASCFNSYPTQTNSSSPNRPSAQVTKTIDSEQKSLDKIIDYSFTVSFNEQEKHYYSVLYDKELPFQNQRPLKLNPDLSIVDFLKLKTGIYQPQVINKLRSRLGGKVLPPSYLSQGEYQKFTFNGNVQLLNHLKKMDREKTLESLLRTEVRFILNEMKK